MEKQPIKEKPIYKKIALDIAAGVANGKYRENQKISGRSTLASQYNVSPETVRRAVALLCEVDVLTTEQGRGIYIRSMKRASEFISKSNDIQYMTNINDEILNLVKQQQQLNLKLSENIKILLDTNQRFNYLNPLTPFEVFIGEESNIANKSLSEIHFWNNTGATVIAIKRNGNRILSPGPYAILMPNDSILIVGDEESYRKTIELVGNI